MTPLIKKYLNSKLSIPSCQDSINIDNDLKKIKRLKKPEDFNRLITNLEFNIKNLFIKFKIN